jgi:hypothetical protein
LKRDKRHNQPKEDTLLLKVIIAILIILFISNIYLYTQLWKLESAAQEYDNLFSIGELSESGASSAPDPQSIEKWKTVLAKAVKLIKVMEQNLLDLGNNFKDEF